MVDFAPDTQSHEQCPPLIRPMLYMHDPSMLHTTLKAHRADEIVRLTVAM